MQSFYHPYRRPIVVPVANEMDLGRYKEMDEADCKKEQQQLIAFLDKERYFFYSRVDAHGGEGRRRELYKFASGEIVPEHLLLFKNPVRSHLGYVVLRADGCFHQVKVVKVQKNKGESIQTEQGFDPDIRPIVVLSAVIERIENLTKITHRLHGLSKRSASSSKNILDKLPLFPSPRSLSDNLSVPIPTPTLVLDEPFNLSGCDIFSQNLDLTEVASSSNMPTSLSPLPSDVKLGDQMSARIAAALVPKDIDLNVQENPEKYGQFLSRVLWVGSSALPEKKTVVRPTIKSINEAVSELKSHLKDEGYAYVEKQPGVSPLYYYLNGGTVSADSLIFKLKKMSALGVQGDLLTVNDDNVFECIVSSESVGYPMEMMFTSLKPSAPVIEAIVLLKKLLQIDKEMSAINAYLQTKGYAYLGCPAGLGKNYSFLNGGTVSADTLILALLHLPGYLCGVDSENMLHGVALTEGLAKTAMAGMLFKSSPVTPESGFQSALSDLKRILHDQALALEECSSLSASFKISHESRQVVGMQQTDFPTAPSSSLY